MKYRKKPVVIEAFQWGRDPMPEWFTDAVKSKVVTFPYGSTIAVIATLEGDHTAQAGDYIIKGVRGELYPCKPDIFGETYEAVGR